MIWVLSLGLWTASPTTAAALDLQWDAPSECPDPTAIQARVASLLGGEERAPNLRARLRVTRARDGYRLVMRLDGDTVHGTRRLSGGDCAALADAAAWLLATAIDPALTVAPEPAPEPPVPAEPEPVPTPPEVVPAAPAPAPRPPPAPSPWVLHATVLGGVLAANLPEPQAELGLALGASYDWLSGELRAMSTLQSGRAFADGTVDIATQTLAFASCGMWGKRFRAGPCAGLAVLRTRGIGHDLPNAQPPQTVYWGQAQLGAQLAVRLVRVLELVVEGGAGFALSPRPNFVVTGSDPNLHQRAWPVTVYGRAGVRFRWPIAPRPTENEPLDDGSRPRRP